MTGPRPLMLCLLALLNTAVWAGIAHLVELAFLLSVGIGGRMLFLAAVFALSLIILFALGAGDGNGNSGGARNGG
jgi:hypothetical protein